MLRSPALTLLHQTEHGLAHLVLGKFVIEMHDHLAKMSRSNRPYAGCNRVIQAQQRSVPCRGPEPMIAASSGADDAEGLRLIAPRIAMYATEEHIAIRQKSELM